MTTDYTRLLAAPRCLAKTRSGGECQSPAVKGKRRCRMHGGTNSGAPKGNRNAFKHGREYTRVRELLVKQIGLHKDAIPPSLVEAKAAVLRVKRATREMKQ